MTAPTPTAATGAVTATLATQQAVSAYTGMVTQVRARLQQYAAQVWGALSSYHRPDIDRMVATLVPVVEAGQAQVSQLTDAYLRTVYAQATGTTIATPAAAVPAYDTMRRGVTADVVYRRPAVTVYTGLTRGVGLRRAVTDGGNRLANIVGTDLQLAATHTAQQTLSGQSRVVGYRRVLTGVRSCGLCIVASTQRYHKARLMPIHPACDCITAPLIGNHDPGQTINSALVSTPDSGGAYDGQTLYLGNLLEPAHAAIADRFGKSYRNASTIDYSKVLITHEHGELGPVLAVQGDKFTKRQISRNDLRRKW